jgi:hypothetical protein
MICCTVTGPDPRFFKAPRGEEQRWASHCGTGRVNFGKAERPKPRTRVLFRQWLFSGVWPRDPDITTEAMVDVIRRAVEKVRDRNVVSVAGRPNVTAQ